MSGQVDGWEVRRGVVDLELCDRALRLLHLDLLRNGWSAQTLGSWLYDFHWFPHLKWSRDVVALAHALPEDWREGELCDPQIVLQFPNVGPAPTISTHTDREPTWAHGRRYRRIVGVPLTPWTERSGGLLLEELDGSLFAPELDPGDAVRIAPAQPHSAGVNLTGGIRIGIYFRWLNYQQEATNA